MVEPRTARHLPEQRSRRRRGALVFAALLLSAAFPACSDDDDGNAESSSTTTESSRTSTTSTSSTSTTQPPGTDLEAVEPIIADLLSQRDDLASHLRQDPESVSDSDGPFADYAALFTPDSPQLADFRESIEGVADEGHADRPGPSGVLEATHLDSMLPSDAADVAFFQVCAFSDYETYEVESGETVMAEAVKVVSGGEARRVDGVWRLHDFLDPDPNLVETLPPGTADPCELEE